jgi:hypothetical protein
MFNGLMRQQMAAPSNLEGVQVATITFCRNALVKKQIAK